VPVRCRSLFRVRAPARRRRLPLRRVPPLGGRGVAGDGGPSA
jgi:hypothetical protein